VELILQVGSGAGFAMVFALLVAAIIWNLGTWYLGLPASSSHTLIGSIIGVGIANQLMTSRPGTSGVDWVQAAGVGKSLLLSPLVGFVCAALLLLLVKVFIRDRTLYQAPEGTTPPPFWNHAVTAKDSQDFIAVSREAVGVLDRYVSRDAVVGDPRQDLTEYICTRTFTPNTMLALRGLVNDVGNEVVLFKELSKVPDDRISNVRNDMYLVGEGLRLMAKSGQPEIAAADWAALGNYKSHIDRATRFIPTWVKVAVAIALGLGTMIGWKRIVVTVGQKIGKTHLSYAQGAAAEITAMATIGAADHFGLPVSTTHVRSSGVAGTGLQWSTVRNLLMAWVLTARRDASLGVPVLALSPHVVRRLTSAAPLRTMAPRSRREGSRCRSLAARRPQVQNGVSCSTRWSPR
jgi:PiT family inorganic phosphate transporter